MKDAADRYKREQDRIFQEIEEMERLERKANQSAIAKERFERLLKSPEQSEFVFRLLQARAFKALLETTDSMDDRLAMVEEFVRAWEKRHPNPTTRI
jgi:hypothetical protein